MKIATKTLLACSAAVALADPVHAALLVEQSLQWADGNNATNATSATFDLASGTKAGSLIVATAYVDNTSTTATNFTSVTFGGEASSAVYSNGRLSAFVFLNPAAGSTEFSFTKSSNSGIGWIIYEISGADKAAITTAEGANSITTETENELVLSFAGNNGAAPSESTDLFTGTDHVILGGEIRGVGTLASASAMVPTPGSQNISWSGTTTGLIALAFEEAPATGDAYDTYALGITSGPTGFTDDANVDGVANGLHFVLGGDADVVDNSILPTAQAQPNGDFTFQFQRADDAVGITTLIFQWGTGLGSWNDVPVLAASSPADGDGVTVDVSDGTPNDDITITVPAANAPDGRIFGRLQANRP